MADNDAKYIIEDGDSLFDKKSTLHTLWQELADHFYPERATFTIIRTLGHEFASHLMTSAPVLARRDLAESFSSMLRRGEWFKLRAAREEWEDSQAKKWLEYATQVQFRAMNDPRAQFNRAAKMGDNDFATFGQFVMQLTLNTDRNGLLYRTWHLKDAAWRENYEGKIDTIHRKWRPTSVELARIFKDRCHPKVIEAANSDKPANRYREWEVRHCIYPKGEGKFPFCSYYVDVENKHTMEDVEQFDFEYIVPRWMHSGTQYAHSPAAMVALPDARLIQQMSLTLLEAGERYVNPPMVATKNIIRSDIQLFPGGVTWVDDEYDERLGQALRPVTQDKSAFPVGFDMREQIAIALKDAFYLSKISLPPLQGADMTATEVRERVQEYIRQALPLFEPMEDEYNSAVCDRAFELLMRNGAFGPVQDMPQSLRGKEVTFQFDTPLQAAKDSEAMQRYQEAIALMQQGMQVDPTLAAEVDLHTAFREAVYGTGAPADWLFDEDKAAERVQEMNAMQQVQQAMAMEGQAREAVGG